MNTHVLPSVASDLSGSMIRKHTHETAQHRMRTFHDFHERRFVDTHGGSFAHSVPASLPFPSPRVGGALGPGASALASASASALGSSVDVFSCTVPSFSLADMARVVPRRAAAMIGSIGKKSKMRTAGGGKMPVGRPWV